MSEKDEEEDYVSLRAGIHFLPILGRRQDGLTDGRVGKEIRLIRWIRSEKESGEREREKVKRKKMRV